MSITISRQPFYTFLSKAHKLTQSLGEVNHFDQSVRWTDVIFNGSTNYPTTVPARLWKQINSPYSRDIHYKLWHNFCRTRLLNWPLPGREPESLAAGGNNSSPAEGKSAKYLEYARPFSSSQLTRFAISINCDWVRANIQDGNALGP